MCLDLGRVYDFSENGPEHYLMDFIMDFIMVFNGRLIINRFFNVRSEKDLAIKFTSDFNRILKKTDDEVYGFLGLSLQENLQEMRKFVYETLIFLAFIDGITNISKYKS